MGGDSSEGEQCVEVLSRWCNGGETSERCGGLWRREGTVAVHGWC